MWINCYLFFVADLANVVKSLARLYKWTPFEIAELYLDDADEFGILFWFEDAKDYINEINNSMGALK